MRTAQHSIVREGLIAGILGATAVAVWFFVVDLISGRPLFTPRVLGEGLLSVFGRGTEATSALLPGFAVSVDAVFDAD